MAIKGKLQILLVEARDLKEREMCKLGLLNCVNPWNHASKPYAYIQYNEQEYRSGVAHGKGNRKEWNERFTLDVEYPVDGENHVYKIIIRLMDKHKLSGDDFIGEATLYVKDVLSIGVEKGKLEVEPQAHRVVQPDNTYSGEIWVAIAFIKAENGTQEEIGSCNGNATSRNPNVII